jgi:hypothetical protein
MLPPHLLTEFVYEERVCTVKLVEERGEFGEMSESTLLLDRFIIHFTGGKALTHFNNTS